MACIYPTDPSPANCTELEILPLTDSEVASLDGIPEEDFGEICDLLRRADVPPIDAVPLLPPRLRRLWRNVATDDDRADIIDEVLHGDT